jgi:hypothetical protein
MALRDTLDELQASAGARAVPMSLLHLWKTSCLSQVDQAVASDDLGRSQSSRCRDARSPPGATLPSSLIGRARAWPLPRHAGRSADSELASAKDEEQALGLTVLLLDEAMGLGVVRSPPGHGRAAGPAKPTGGRGWAACTRPPPARWRDAIARRRGG